MLAKSKSQIDLDACRQAVDVCACFHFRKASRAVTQLFDETLAPSGLRSTQLVILVHISITETPTVLNLAADLVMDRSTLARNLKPLEKQRLIKIVPGKKDRRTRLISLTARGRKTLLSALPLWQEAQTRFVGRLGQRRWTETVANLKASVAASQADP